MAKTQWIILFVTFCLSFLSFGLIIVSFATTHWIDAEASSPDFVQNSEINYGLFAGLLQRKLTSSPAYFDLTMTCLFEENKCIFSCQNTLEERINEMQKILNEEPLTPCPRVQVKHSTVNDENAYLNEELNTQHNSTLSNTDLEDSQNDIKITSIYGQRMLNAGLWVTTLLFLSMAILFSFISGVFSLVNIILNPVEPMLSIFGLYIWNGIAAGASLMTLIIWGSLFGSSITDNVAITDTLDKDVNYSSEGLASNGFSYWILLCPMLLHFGNIGLLRLRNYLIDKEPPPPTITVEKNDFTILLY